MTQKIKDKLYVIAPETVQASAATIDSLIEIAKLQTKLSCNGKRELAIAYLAAHTYAISQRGGSGSGAVGSIKEGDLQISYQGLASSKSLYGSTPYGIEYERLIKSNVMGVRNRMVREPGCE